MTEIDQIQINLSEGTLGLLNFCLAFLTFGVALDISLKDFKQVLKKPGKIFTGLFSQWILLPIWTLLLIYLFQPVPSIALGMALVAACPGGNVSNYTTHLARGNAALSVTLTSIVTIGAIIMTPLSFTIVSQIIPGTEEILKKISLDPLSVVFTIVQLIVIPLLLGLFISNRATKLSNIIRRPVKVISMVIFLAIIAGAVIANTENIFKYLKYVFLIVLLHNGIAYAIGYYFSRTCRLPVEDSRAISFETGIQNAGLGLILIFNFFEGLGGMLLVAAWWGVWDLISSFALAMWWSRQRQRGII